MKAFHKRFLYAFIDISCIAYLKIYVVPRSWIFILWSWNSHGRSMLKKTGHPGSGFNSSFLCSSFLNITVKEL